jgi:NifB/MoaA-like Fe-S oxidoreductase
MSIAVVPVGMTAHRKKPLRTVEKDDAQAALDIINRFQQRFRRKHGEHIVLALMSFI